MRDPSRKKSNLKKTTEKRKNGKSNRSHQVDRAFKDVPYEIAKVLQIKRWEPQVGPFRGFGSPPGRF